MVAPIVRLAGRFASTFRVGLGTGLDTCSGPEAWGIPGIVHFSLAVNTQLKGEDFCLFSMALTGLFSVALTGWIRELFVRLFLLLFGFLFESRKQGFGV